jgi:hypothetical protein
MRSPSLQRRFGPIQIDYGTVQSKVNNKYDQWHKAILTKFGALVGETTAKLFQVCFLHVSASRPVD